MTDRTRVTVTVTILAFAWVIASSLSQVPTMFAAMSSYNAAKAEPEPTATPYLDPKDPFAAIGVKTSSVPYEVAHINWERDHDPAILGQRISPSLVTIAQHLTIAVAIVLAVWLLFPMVGRART